MIKTDPTTHLYPEIEPYATGILPVGGSHALYYEECGNPNGRPVVFLHGGPGGGCDADDRRHFNPEKFRIILFDQRGCGRSTPHSELTNNTTPHLVEDVDRLRQHLGIEKWHVVGGSWGSTLSLLYAEAYPENVLSMVIYSVFLCRPQELTWLYQSGADNIWPDAFEPYKTLIPEQEQHDLISAYYKRLRSEDPKIRAEAARRWTTWEISTLYLEPDLAQIEKDLADADFLDAFARIECHFFINNGFMESNQILDNINRIAHIPCTIIQGRFDTVTPVKAAWDLHKAWPASTLKILPTGAHARRNPGMRESFMEAVNAL